MMDWLQLLYAICTSGEPPARWREIAFATNIATALAYFWIPAVMAVVFARWREELPYRWLWIGFVTFITACGLSHVVHAIHLLRDQTPHTWPELLVLIFTAVVSLITAAGFTYLLPRIMRLASPARARRKMEEAVEQATAELQAALEHQRILLLEVHHRVKNNLQVVASLISLHMRDQKGEPPEGLADLRERIEAIASVHGQLQVVGASTLRALPFVHSLASSIASARGGNAQIDVRGDDFVVPLDHAASFALIVHEVVTTAQERTRPGGASVEVHLRAQGPRRILTVTGPAGKAPDGIGRKLVTALAVQLDATIDWSPDGSRFRMEFDEQAPAQRIARNSATVPA